MRVLIAICALVAISADACGNSEKRGAVDTGRAADASAAPASTATLPTRTDTPAASPTAAAKAFAVGDTVTSKAGNTITVRSYEQPWASTNRFSNPHVGKVFATADIEACAGAAPESGSAGVNPFNFELQMPDNTRLQPSTGRQPALHDTQLIANDCVRGFVTFDVPDGVRPLFVIFKGSSQIKWAVH